MTQQRSAPAQTTSWKAQHTNATPRKTAVAIIAGGTRGIGLPTAETLMARGTRVCISYGSDEAAADDARRRLLSTSGEGALVVPSDVRDENAATGLVEQVVEKWGRLDITVSAAGINRRLSFLDVAGKTFDEVFSVNVRGLYFTTQASARAMITGGPGRVVNISSIAARHALTDRSLYEATKAAVDALTRSLACELTPFGIRANSVAPGLVDTKMTQAWSVEDIGWRTRRVPLQRMARSSETGDLISYVALDAPDYLTDVVITIGGGRTRR